MRPTNLDVATSPVVSPPHFYNRLQKQNFRSISNTHSRIAIRKVCFHLSWMCTQRQHVYTCIRIGTKVGGYKKKRKKMMDGLLNRAHPRIAPTPRRQLLLLRSRSRALKKPRHPSSARYIQCCSSNSTTIQEEENKSLIHPSSHPSPEKKKNKTQNPGPPPLSLSLEKCCGDLSVIVCVCGVCFASVVLLTKCYFLVCNNRERLCVRKRPTSNNARPGKERIDLLLFCYSTQPKNKNQKVHSIDPDANIIL